MNTVASMPENFEVSSINQVENLLGRPVVILCGSVPYPGDNNRALGCVALGNSDASVGDAVPLARAVTFEGKLSDQTLSIVPLLAAALRIGKTASLELGHTVVIIGDCMFTNLMGEVSRWWSCKRINVRNARLDEHAETPFTAVLSSNDRNMQQHLEEAIDGAFALCFIDFSGDADNWSVLLETAPYWSQVYAGAPVTVPMTIDFYNNVHRKGVTINGRQIDAAAFFTPESGLYTEDEIRAAVDLLSKDTYRDAISRCVISHRLAA